ncbi:hypothetical protein SAMN04487898_12532, partial [Pedobacter sp. ok626]|uniref:beta strand repeat-containing protein n=1 Tax=Pedobacter sp. ok626 TaxID=1761882 RepID=UPI000887614C
MKKSSAFRLIPIVFFLVFFASLNTFAQLTPGDIAIIGYNGNSSPAELAIVTLAVIPANQTIQITDRGWDSTNGFLVNPNAEGTITWSTGPAPIPSGTVIKISITPGGAPTATGFSTYGSATAVGWGTLVTAGGGDNWFIYTGIDASPSFIFGFANWFTNNPGGGGGGTPWQTSGAVNSTTSYLPPALAGNFAIALTGNTLHGDYNYYHGIIIGTKEQILADLAGTTDWVHDESTPAILTPGGTSFPGTNPIFTLPPSVTKISSSTANGTYTVGDIISVLVTFSEIVNVSGTPKLNLNSGANASAIYVSGTGSSTLTFNYTIAAGENSSDLDYAAVNSLLIPNGATIKNSAIIDADLTLAAPGTAGSLGINKNIVIDGIAPTLAITSDKSQLKSAETANITFTFSEDPGSTFTWNGTTGDVVVTGGTLGPISGAGLTRTATFTPTANTNGGTVSITVAAATYTDAAGNNGGAGTTPALTFDTQIPTLSTVAIASNNATSTLAKVGNTATLTFTSSETVQTPVVTIAGHSVTPTASGNNWTAIYTFIAGDADGLVTYNIAYSDLAGNAGTAVSIGTGAITFDKVAPTLPTVSIASNNSNTIKAKTGDIITLSFTSNEVIASPVVTIATHTVTATNNSGNNWTATYTLTNTDAEGIVPFNIAFADLAGNTATGTTAVTNVTFDRTVPALSSVTIAANNIAPAKAKTSDVVTLNFTASEPLLIPVVSIAGHPVTPSNTGGNDWTASYTMIGADTEGIIPFNIAFTDLVGNAGLAVSGTTNSSTVTFDKTAPAVPTGLAAAAGVAQNVITWNANSEPDFSSYILYGGTASNLTIPIQTLPAGTLTYTHTGLINGTTYYYEILAVDQTGNQSAKSANVTATPKASQTITFNSLASAAYGDPSFNLTASSSSGLPLTYTSSNPLVATVSGNTITIIAAGTTSISASQPGNSIYYPATSVSQNLVVNKKSITVTAAAGQNKIYGTNDPTFAYTITSGGSLVPGDSFIGALTRAIGENIGTTYAISQGDLDAGINYTISYVPANFAITAKAITVTADAGQNKVYGTNDPTFAYTITSGGPLKSG